MGITSLYKTRDYSLGKKIKDVVLQEGNKAKWLDETPACHHQTSHFNNLWGTEYCTLSIVILTEMWSHLFQFRHLL